MSRRSLRAATARGRALGARASCPRYAPPGALVRRWLGACAPVGASEGKMPSPPGARLPFEGPTLIGQALHPLACQNAFFGHVASVVCAWPRPGTGPGGEGILPSLCAARRIGSKTAWGMRACRRERGQDALAPRGPFSLRGPLPWQGKRTSACLSKMHSSGMSRRGVCDGHGQGRALGATASCPRYAPPGALVRRRLRQMRACRRERGQDALAPRGRSCLRGPLP